ncbi:MAG: DUF2520 domain-containing protein [Chitinophagaceae bacterium]|nr:DUF2520 domain-containing protein [Chitinophagaceae bacterium]
MQVVMIGAGNMAWVLAKSLVSAKFHIKQVYSRHLSDAVLLTKEVGGEAVDSIESIDKDADIYFIAVSDKAITNIAAQLNLGDKPVYHTSGTVSKEVINICSSCYGVFWPMKMLRKSMNSFGELNVAIDGSNQMALDIIISVAHKFTNTVIQANDIKRRKMHYVATLTANFSNCLYSLGAEFCEKEGIDFALFYPIIQETAIAITTAPPHLLQAGPAFRGDLETISLHKSFILDDMLSLDVYNILSDAIVNIKKAHSNE